MEDLSRVMTSGLAHMLALENFRDQMPVDTIRNLEPGRHRIGIHHITKGWIHGTVVQVCPNDDPFDSQVYFRDRDGRRLGCFAENIGYVVTMCSDDRTSR